MTATSPLKLKEESKETSVKEIYCIKCFTCRLCSKTGKNIAKVMEAVPEDR